MILRLHTVNILPQSFYSSYHSKMAAIALESLSFLSFKFGFTNLIVCVNLFKKKNKNKKTKKKKEKIKEKKKNTLSVCFFFIISNSVSLLYVEGCSQGRSQNLKLGGQFYC